MESVKADAYASAVQTHTAVRPGTQEPEAGGPTQQESTANEAGADQRKPQSRWPPSAFGACGMTPPTAKGHHPGIGGDPQGQSELSHYPGAAHCCPDRSNGGHRQERPRQGNASGSPSGPKSGLRCVLGTPPPQGLWQRPPANGSAPRNALDERDTLTGLCSPATLARQPAVAAIGGGREKHDPRASPTPRWVHRFWPNSRDGLQHQPLLQAH